MATGRRMRFVHGQLAWMVATILALSLLGAFSYELFFILSVLGLLVVTGLTLPATVTPQWRRRLRWLVRIALVGVGLVVIRRIIEILPPEVLP
jgi:predicted membrane channel-forming protein YqfA (hemolysin III family)